MIITRPALSGSIGPVTGLPLTNLVLWLKADTQVYNDAGTTLATNGQTVQQWNDQSGLGYNISQATSARRPTFRSTGGPNGLPSVQFDGSSPNGMEVANNADFNLNNESSMFALIKFTSLPNDDNSIISKDNNSSPGPLYWFVGSSGAGSKPEVDRPFDQAGTKATTAMGTANFVVIGTRLKTSAGSTYYFNGATNGSPGTFSTGTTTTKPLRLGWFRDTHDGPLFAHLTELLLYKADVGAGGAAIINSYLGARGGLF